MSSLFDPAVKYPNDGTGEYVDLKGEVVSVGYESDGFVGVTVATDFGQFVGFWEMPSSGSKPSVRQIATIRIYNAGGGSCPDNSIRSFGHNFGYVGILKS
jgi:hypothetical protein